MRNHLNKTTNIEDCATPFESLDELLAICIRFTSELDQCITNRLIFYLRHWRVQFAFYIKLWCWNNAIFSSLISFFWSGATSTFHIYICEKNHPSLSHCLNIFIHPTECCKFWKKFVFRYFNGRSSLLVFHLYVHRYSFLYPKVTILLNILTSRVEISFLQNV